MARAVVLNHYFCMVFVLLIEDDADLLAEMKLGLEKAGHTVEGAASGDKGIALFDRQPIDVVITDVIMDDGEGIETLRQLRDRVPDFPIIAISGNPFYLKNMKMLGATIGLLKPFSIKALNQVVRQVL